MRLARPFLSAALLSTAVSAQPDFVCGTAYEGGSYRAPLAAAPPTVRFLDRLALVLEYPSAYSVHSPVLSTSVALRSQNGS